MALAEDNPYNWMKHTARVEVRRSELGPVLEALRKGAGIWVLGGRGMGKSILLKQVEAELAARADTRVVRIASAPTDLDVHVMHRALAKALGREPSSTSDNTELLRDYLTEPDAPARLVLLYDEFERYARKNGREAPGRHFFNDLETARRELDGLGIVAAGSLGVFLFRDVLGSSFLSRAVRVVMSPFERAALVELTAPFHDRAEPLADDALDALWLASGGNPALVTYGLEELWSVAPGDRTSAAIAHAYTRFQADHADFLQDVEKSFADPSLSDVPRRAWDVVQRSDSPIPRAELTAAMAGSRGALNLDLRDVLHMLQAAGLVHLDDAPGATARVAVRPIPSILSLPQAAPEAPDLTTELREHLELLLVRMHAASADFYRSRAGEEDSGRRALVPESVFTAYLALGLELASWRVEREAQSVTGRTDLKLEREGRGGYAVVEVKIWGRRDYRDAQRQIEGYWSRDVVAAAVVMLTDATVPDWSERYRAECLPGVEASKLAAAAPLAGWSARGVTADGLATSVDHVLLRLPRR